MFSGSQVHSSSVAVRQAAAGDAAALRDVLAQVMAAKPQKLTTMIQLRVTEDTARRLDELVARIDQHADINVTRSDLVRAAVDILTGSDPS